MSRPSRRMNCKRCLKDGGFFDRDLKKRKQAVPLIENLYKERGYIDVKVEPPRNELNESNPKPSGLSFA